MLVPRLEKAKHDIVLKVNNPEKLEHVIRGAYKQEEYAWIKDKFIISIKDDSIIFKIKQLNFQEEETIETVEDADFNTIVEILLFQRRDKVNFVNYILEPEEINNINEWCKANDFTCEYKDNILQVKKNE